MNEKLQTLYNIGPVLAKKIIDELSSQKLIDEKKLKYDKYNIHDIRAILRHPKIFDSLPIATQIDLLYYPLKIIPRQLLVIIDTILHKCVKNIKLKIAGSYLREKSISRDIDIVMINSSKYGLSTIDYVIEKVNKCNKILYINEPYARGTDKITLLFEVLVPKKMRNIPEIKDHMTTTNRVRLKTDIFLCDKNNYIFTLLFATGSGKFNIRMRSVAKKKGYLLNHKGLYKKFGNNEKMQKVPIKNIRELFKILGMHYVVPHDRND